ncbi:DinB superfamily protein [Pedobacter yulinensis]|uniref:DinB superfamily protein n=1 Tax=Pedobacter yulinensis TaxID=2126353 RepID=A0A2T3HMR3_9SPHI|nr:DinB family protein [Pedobacter yulinensis]PST83661.1 DinB superfamily protein [Pedobacter yulinensis]
MLSTTLKTLLIRDLNKLKEELELYQDEANIWRIDHNILNSAGNLCLHLAGNLNAYIGGALGHSGYIRNRPEEFSQKNLPRAELIDKIKQTIAMVEATLPLLTDVQMQTEYPDEVNGTRQTTGYFLVHLAMHLSYHLGQVNYHRRLLDR